MLHSFMHMAAISENAKRAFDDLFEKVKACLHGE
jgi:hypothetical protein